MPQVELVRSKEEHLDVLVGLHLALNLEMAKYARFYPEEALVPHNVEYLVRTALVGDEVLAWVALVDAEPVGFVSIAAHGSPIPGSQRLTGTILNLYVVPRMRRQGVGRVLAEHAIGCLTALGAESVDLQFLIQNQAAARFWASLGFTAEHINAILPLQ